MVSGREIGILKTVQTVGQASAMRISRRLRVSSEYVASIMNSLVAHGYLEEHNGVYWITPAGQRVLSPYKYRKLIPENEYTPLRLRRPLPEEDSDWGLGDQQTSAPLIKPLTNGDREGG